MGCRGQTFDQILNDVERQYGKFHYVRRDTVYPEDKKPKLMQALKDHAAAEIAGFAVRSKNTADGVKFVFDKDAWLLFRISGTEPLLRVYAESTDQAQAQALVNWGESFSKSIA